MKQYTVEYKDHSAGKVNSIVVIAKNKENAHEIAVYDQIPKLLDGALPYSAWVAGVTYNNGKYKRFNTFEGKPY